MKRIKEEKKKKNLLNFKLTYNMTNALHECMPVLYLYDLNLLLLIFEGHFHENLFLIFCSIVFTMALLLSLSISIFSLCRFRPIL